MVYVDLNPIRAKIAVTPESSEHTSIKKRIEALEMTEAQPSTLMAFVGNPREPMPQGLPFELKEYLSLVDWTGRILREDKCGAIAESFPPILDRIDIKPDKWLALTQRFEGLLKSLAGEAWELRRAAQKMGYQRTPGLSACQAAF